MNRDEFKLNIYVRDKNSGFIGYVDEEPFEEEDGTECVYVNGIWDEEWESDVYPLSDLESLPPVEIDEDILRSIVRYERTPEDLKFPYDVYENCIYKGDYQVSVEDLLCGIQNMKKVFPGNIRKLFAWIRFFEDIGDDAGIPFFRVKVCFDETEIISFAFGQIRSLLSVNNEDEVLIKSFLDEAAKDLSNYMEDRNKPFAQKRIPLSIMERSAGAYDSDSIDQASVEEQLLFKHSLDTLSEMEEPNTEALQKKGYCIYCGTKIYPQNWPQARDIFLKYYGLTGDASAANTLGYIFYYGRCNGGIPEYDKAFYYFSIGHAYGYFESTYKLADMFAHGYGVVKSGETAFRMYSAVYEENYKGFLQGQTTGKMADAALRMGNCYRKGIGVDVNLNYAYSYYLEAFLAINLRIKEVNYYGDQVVYNSIKKALREVKQELDPRETQITFSYPYLFKYALYGNRRAKLCWKEKTDGSLILNLKPMKLPDEFIDPKMLVTIPQADYCEFVETITLKTSPNSRITSLCGGGIIFNRFLYEDDVIAFYHDEKKTGELDTKDFIFTVPELMEEEKNGTQITFASVRFNPQGRSYDYICELDDVSVGDLVIIAGYDGETVVEVTDLFTEDAERIAIPLERYKRIIRKA